jgi:tripartite-type tricarboxylate transporter receptor subunit TctC
MQKVFQAGRRSAIAAAALTAMVTWVSGTAFASDAWPQKTIKVLVPYTAGGPVDSLTRILMENVAKSLGQSIIIENRPGANTQVATAQLARSAPDGYHFGIVPAAYTTNQVLAKKLPYKPDDFVAVSHMVNIPLFLFTPASNSAKNVKELMEWARKEKPSYASTGPGSTGHLLGAMFAIHGKFDATHVGYNGSAQAMPDLMGGLVSYMFDPATGGMPHVKAGKLKVLAVSQPQRCACAPDVPTMAESGFPEMVQGSWLGVMAPKGTPQAVVQRMSDEVAKALQNPELKQRLETMGFGGVGSKPAAFQALIDSDIKAYEAIARKANISLEN